MYTYGNTRIAARRARLLPADALARLAGAESADAMLLMLERFDDWRSILRELGTLVTPARSGIELAIERHRSAALSGLAGMYAPPARGLVEALVLPLDLQRVLEVLRRRRGGEATDSIATGVSRGALLDEIGIGLIARAANPPAVARLLGTLGLVSRAQAKALAARWAVGTGATQQEADLHAAFDVARRERAAASPDGRTVLAVLDAERDEAAAVASELRQGGTDDAVETERQARLARLDALAARSRRDPLGIGVVIGYVAAVDAESIRLRAALAGVAGGWSRERVGAWLGSRAA